MTSRQHEHTHSFIIGASLSKPHIDHDNGPRVRNNAIHLFIYVAIYLSMYHLPHACRTLVPKIHVRPKMLRVFQYIDVLTCVIYNCTRLNGQERHERLELLVSVVQCKEL